MSPEETLLCAVLRGEAPPWPATDAAFAARFLAASGQHGTQPLSYYLLSPTPAWETWPTEVRKTLQRQTWRQSAWETLAREETARVLAALAMHGVQAVLMKGAPLAYSHYPKPFLRPHGDTDLLLRREDMSAAQTVLSDLGYVSPLAVSGDWVSYQRLFSRTVSAKFIHTLDVHWRLSNGELFAQTLDYPQLLDQSVPAPAFGSQARALGSTHALLLACMHRADHFTQGHAERLLWLYDIHLLVTRMNGEQLTEFARLARQKQMAGVCLDGLRAAERRLDTPLPDELTAALAAPGPKEPSARLLTVGPLASLWLHFKALPGWRSKLRFLHELGFPPADYMQAKYGAATRYGLPVLYIRRAAEGFQKRWRC